MNHAAATALCTALRAQAPVPASASKGRVSSTQEASDSTAWELKSFALGLQTPNGLNMLQMYVSSRCQLT